MRSQATRLFVLVCLSLAVGFHQATALPVYTSSFVLPSPDDNLTLENILLYFQQSLNIYFVTNSSQIKFETI